MSLPKRSSSADQDPNSELDDLLDQIDERMVSEGLRGGEEVPIPASQLKRLLDVTRAVHRIHDRQKLLTFVSDRLREMFDAENSFVILFDEEGKPHIQSAHVKPTSPANRLPISSTILERVIRERKPICIDNAAEEKEFRDQSSIRLLKISSALLAPLIVEDKVIGVLQFDHRGQPQPFPANDFRLLESFADQVAIAFSNLQLMELYDKSVRDMKAAQFYVVQAERMSALGEMAAGIAHDFNNTLFVALGLCDFLLTKNELNQDVRKEIEKIRTCGLDATETVRRLQSFARDGDLASSAEASDLRAVAQKILDYTQHKWSDEAQRDGKFIEVRTELSPTPYVQAGPAEIREILTNLIFNAVDSIEKHGSITVATGVQDGRAFVSVRDTGNGMDEATKRKVFEPFFTTKGTRGVGFGLSTSWSIARRLHGELAVESERQNGSTFTLWLPLSKVQSESTSGQGETTHHILVIDDDASVLDLMITVLESFGYAVSAFSSAEQGLEEFREENFDVVITDQGMPGMTGAELIREMKKAKPDVPIILLSGWGTEGEDVEDIQGLVAAAFDKPTPLTTLREALEQILNQ